MIRIQEYFICNPKDIKMSKIQNNEIIKLLPHTFLEYSLEWELVLTELFLYDNAICFDAENHSFTLHGHLNWRKFEEKKSPI